MLYCLQNKDEGESVCMFSTDAFFKKKFCMAVWTEDADPQRWKADYVYLKGDTQTGNVSSHYRYLSVISCWQNQIIAMCFSLSIFDQF